MGEAKAAGALLPTRFPAYGSHDCTVMNHQKHIISHEANDVEIGLLDLGRVLWRQKWIVVGAAALGLLVAVFYLNVATYKYTAELKVSPSQSSGASSGKAGGLASLASIAGVNLGQGGGATPFELYLEGLRSGLSAEVLVERPDIMKVIFQAEWNDKDSRFKQPESFIGNSARFVKSALGIPVYSWREPNSARLRSYIQENVKISESPKSPVVTISFSHPDPKFAAQFLDTVHQSLDENLRQKALIRSNKYIVYLTAQLQQVTIAEHRAALAQALSEQERFRMTASSGLAYAADPFGQVTSSLSPTSPRPMVVIFLSIVLGTVLGSLLALARWWLQEEKKRKATITPLGVMDRLEE